MRVAILGAGTVGSTLGRLLAGAGHEVTLCFARDLAGLQAAAARAGAVSAPVAEAVSGADAVVLAVPWVALGEALDAAGDLDGMTVVDAVNAVAEPVRPSVAGWIAERRPGARVVKAFNTVFATLFPEARARRASMVICGDDAAAKETTARLVADVGFAPVDAGGLAQAADVEAFARLVIGIAYREGRGPFTYGFDLAPAGGVA